MRPAMAAIARNHAQFARAPTRGGRCEPQYVALRPVLVLNSACRPDPEPLPPPPCIARRPCRSGSQVPDRVRGTGKTRERVRPGTAVRPPRVRLFGRAPSHCRQRPRFDPGRWTRGRYRAPTRLQHRRQHGHRRRVLRAASTAAANAAARRLQHGGDRAGQAGIKWRSVATGLPHTGDTAASVCSLPESPGSALRSADGAAVSRPPANTA